MDPKILMMMALATVTGIAVFAYRKMDEDANDGVSTLSIPEICNDLRVQMNEDSFDVMTESFCDATQAGGAPDWESPAPFQLCGDDSVISNDDLYAVWLQLHDAPESVGDDKDAWVAKYQGAVDSVCNKRRRLSSLEERAVNHDRRAPRRFLQSTLEQKRDKGFVESGKFNTLKDYETYGEDNQGGNLVGELAPPDEGENGDPVGEENGDPEGEENGDPEGEEKGDPEEEPEEANGCTGEGGDFLACMFTCTDNFSNDTVVAEACPCVKECDTSSCSAEEKEAIDAEVARRCDAGRALSDGSSKPTKENSATSLRRMLNKHDHDGSDMVREDRQLWGHGHWPHGHWPHVHWPHAHWPHRHNPHRHNPHRHNPHYHYPHHHSSYWGSANTQWVAGASAPMCKNGQPALWGDYAAKNEIMVDKLVSLSQDKNQWMSHKMAWGCRADVPGVPPGGSTYGVSDNSWEEQNPYTFNFGGAVTTVTERCNFLAAMDFELLACNTDHRSDDYYIKNVISLAIGNAYFHGASCRATHADMDHAAMDIMFAYFFSKVEEITIKGKVFTLSATRSATNYLYDSFTRPSHEFPARLKSSSLGNYPDLATSIVYVVKRTVQTCVPNCGGWIAWTGVCPSYYSGMQYLTGNLVDKIGDAVGYGDIANYNTNLWKANSNYGACGLIFSIVKDFLMAYMCVGFDGHDVEGHSDYCVNGHGLRDGLGKTEATTGADCRRQGHALWHWRAGYVINTFERLSNKMQTNGRAANGY